MEQKRPETAEKNKVRWIVSLPDKKALIAILIFANIYQAGRNEISEYRHDSERKDWQAEKKQIIDETYKTIFDFYVKANESRQNIQQTTDSIAADAREIKRITKSHFLKMQKLQQK